MLGPAELPVLSLFPCSRAVEGQGVPIEMLAIRLPIATGLAFVLPW